MPKSCWCKNDKLEEYSIDYYACRLCSTLVSKADFSDDIYHVQNEASDLYGDHYWEKDMLEIAGVSSLDELVSLYLSHRALYWLKYFLHYCLPPANVAEIGGGLGQFSYLLKLTGFSQTEYELSPNICEYSRKELGINVICGDFNETKDLFDGIVATDLIEHILDPVRLMTTAFNHLADNGVLCIQTPSYDENFTYEEMLERKPRFSQLLRPEQHIYLFSKKSIEKLLTNCGFHHIKYVPAVFGDDYDMFLFASKKPLVKNSDKQILEAVSKSNAGRFVLAALKLFEEHQESEADRADRLVLLHKAEETQKELTHQNSELVSEMEKLNFKNRELVSEIEKLSFQNRELVTKIEKLALQVNEAEHLSKEQASCIIELTSRNKAMGIELYMAYESVKNIADELEIERRLSRLLIKTIKDRTVFTHKLLSSAEKNKHNRYAPLGNSLKIAVDLTPFRPDGSIGGVKQLIIELIKGFSEKSGISLVLLCSSWNMDYFTALGLKNTEIFEVLHDGSEVTKLKERIIKGPAKYGRKLQVDKGVNLLFCPFSAPTFHTPEVPVVSTINDIQHEFYPMFFSQDEYRNRTAFYINIARHVSSVICISKYTKETFCEKYNFSKNNAYTVYIAVQDRLKKSDNLDILRTYQLEPNLYLLYPANFWEHKNHKLLLIAFSVYIKRSENIGIKLVLTGNTLDKKGYFDTLCKHLGIENQIVITGYIKESELQALMTHMKGMCYPSLFEGFSIPIVEAMHFNKPISCSNTTSLPEVGGNGVYYFNPAKPDEIADGIDYIVTVKVDDRMLDNYRQICSKFDRIRMIDEYVSVFRKTITQENSRKVFANDNLPNITGLQPDGWSSQFIVVNTAGFAGNRLIMEFLHPDFLKDTFQITIINGAYIKKYKTQIGNTLTIDYKIHGSAPEIVIEVSPCWIPSQILPDSDDSRLLGLMVNKISGLEPNGRVLDLYNR